MSIRVRLSFDELTPGYSKKTWFLFDTASCRLVADLEHLIQRKFELQKNSTLNLYNEGFLLPAQERIELVRDGDIIRVEKQANFCTNKRQAKWNAADDDLVSNVKISKKQKLDDKSQLSLKIQEKKNKKIPMKIIKKQGRKWEKQPINTADSNSKRKSQNDKVKVGKPRKSNNMVQKDKHNVLALKRHLSKNAAVTKNRTVSSSSESSSESSTSSLAEEKYWGKKGNIVERGQNKGLPPGRYSSKNASNTRNETLLSSELSTSSLTEDEILGNRSLENFAKRAKNGNFSKDCTSSSSSTEDSSDDAFNTNIKFSNKKLFSSSSSSSSSSTLSSSVDLSVANQKEGLNLKSKEKGLSKYIKNKAKFHQANAATDKGQNKNVKNLPRTPHPSKKEGLNSKAKDEVLDKNTNSKVTLSSSSKGQVETARIQSKVSEQEKKNTNSTNGNTFPRSGFNRSKSTYSQPPSINNSHIRFDSDEENEYISACEEDLNPLAQSHDKNSHDTAADGNSNMNCAQGDSEIPSNNESHLQNKVEMKRKRDEIIDSMGNAAATKKTAVDYSTLVSLCGPPRVGDRIAYKILELSASYTPEMSDYKEGIVLGYNPVTNEVLLELAENSLSKPLGDGNISTKFELIYEDDHEEINEIKPPVTADRKVLVLWTSMVDPKLIAT